MHFHVLSVPGSAKKHMANFKSLVSHKFPRGCLLLKKVVLPVTEKKKKVLSLNHQTHKMTIV